LRGVLVSVFVLEDEEPTGYVLVGWDRVPVFGVHVIAKFKVRHGRLPPAHVGVYVGHREQDCAAPNRYPNRARKDPILAMV
jgi:hypothetical protein